MSEFEQSLDDMLYAAYADGRADERDDMRKTVIEWTERLAIEDRAPLVGLLLHISGAK